MRPGGREVHDLGAPERPQGLRISVLPDTAAGGCEDALYDLLRPEIRAAVWAKFKDKDGHKA